MLDYVVYTSTTTTTDQWWQHLRPRLTIAYILIAALLLLISITGQMRFLNEIGRTFGGFFWAIDTDRQVVIVSAAASTPATSISASSLTSNQDITGIKVADQQGHPIFRWQQRPTALTAPLTEAYKLASPGDPITYTIQENGAGTYSFTLPAGQFTWDMWVQNYGLALLAGISWLVAGTLLLMTALEWIGAIEGITLLPPAMLFLLYSHWGNVQQPYSTDAVTQLLWIPSFALLGAGFIHLSLAYRPETMSVHRRPGMLVDVLPYVPLIALVAFEISSFMIAGQVASRPNLIASLGYGVFGGILSAGIGVVSLLRVLRILPGKPIPANVRRRLGDLLTLWISGIGLGFALGILPILLVGHTLLPPEIFYVVAAIYPALLFYAIRSLRLIDRLQVTLEQREEALLEQQKTAQELRQANAELTQATSLLLHADANLRSVLSQRIHDQPKQQALRIRSLLGHWQHKLRAEAARDPSGKVPAQPVIDTLEKARAISEELESDLRKLQMLVEDAYQRRSLGLLMHLDKLINEDLPALHPEATLKVRADLRALDGFGSGLEQSAEGTRIAEAISYTITQALLNTYNHAQASFASVLAYRKDGYLEVYVTDDGRGFDTSTIQPEKTSMFKAILKVREAGGTLSIHSVTLPYPQHGTTVALRIPIPHTIRTYTSGPLLEPPI